MGTQLMGLTRVPGTYLTVAAGNSEKAQSQ